MIVPLKMTGVALVSSAVAAACLASPALADSASTAPAEAPAAQAASMLEGVAQDGLVFTSGYAGFAGVYLQIPQSWSASVSEDGTVATFANANETAFVMVTDKRDAAVLGENDDPTEVFEELAQVSLAELGTSETSELTALGESALASDGTPVYVYDVTVTEEDATYRLEQLYIPAGEGGYVLVQSAINTTAATEAESKEYDSDVRVLGTMAAASSFAAAGLQGNAGITFDVPEGIEPMGEGTWTGTSSNIMIVTTGGIANGASAISDAEYKALFRLATSQFGGKEVASGIIEAKGVSVHYASYSASVSGEEYFIAVALVPVDDDTLSCLLVMCDMEAAKVYNTALTDMLASISLAE